MRVSEAACRLSIRLLFAERQSLLWGGGNLPKVDGCYLWTFTFPDKVSPQEAASRFRSATMNWKHQGKVGVRVLEQGDNGERRFHYHVVTCQRWEHAAIFAEMKPYGFGFVFVVEVPKEKLEYIAKYVGKRPTRAAKGLRRWGCIGFDGVPRTRAEFIETRLHSTVLGPLHGLCDIVRWNWGEPYGITTCRVRFDTECETVTRTMEMKPAQSKEILADISAGLLVMVGEYRGQAVRSLNLRDKKNPALSIPRLVVEHNVEVNGTARAVTEWLPLGAIAEQYKGPANRGDVVKVIVEGLRFFGGKATYSGAIKPLVQLHL